MPTSSRSLTHVVAAAFLLLTVVRVSAATVTVGSTAVPCDAREVAVSLTADQPTAFIQLSFTVTYDAAQLSFSHATLNESLQGWAITPTSSLGRVALQIRPPSRLSLVGSFATLTFQRLGSSTDRIPVRVSEISVLLNTATNVQGDGADGMILLDCGDPLPPAEHPSGLQFRPVAGPTSGPASVDGRGTDARFGRISGIAAASDGTLYVADRGNFTIRRVTREGDVRTIAGHPGRLGTSDGNGSDALFVSPHDIAIGRDGTLYVLDVMFFFTEARVRRVTSEGVVTTIYRQSCAALATNTVDQCGLIMSIAVDVQDNVYLLDSSRVLRISPSGAISVLAGGDERGFRDGIGTAAQFETSSGSSLTVGPDGNVYVYDTRNRAIRKITPAGVTTTIAAGDPFQNASNQSGIAVLPDGTILMHHVGNVYRVTSAGVVTETASEPLFVEGRFALGSSGERYVADGWNEDELWSMTTDGNVQRIAGLTVQIGFADGHGEFARLNSSAMTYNPRDGLLYTSDYNPNADHCALRTVSLAGDVRTVPTTQEVCADFLAVAPDGALIAAVFPASLFRIAPTGIVSAIAIGPPNCFMGALAVDGAGSVYVSCGSYLAKVTPSGSFVVAAEEIGAEALTVLPNGDLIAASQFRLLRITSNGRVFPFAGTGLFPLRADATPVAASFGFIEALAADASGGVYVVDVGFGNWALLKHVTPAGDVATIAGGGIGKQDGDASIARFAHPRAIAALPDGVALSEGTEIRIGIRGGASRRRSVRH
jgi:hemin uptake protein HemP